GQQQYNALVLCKHLVQAVHPSNAAFFREVVRRRTIPFYHHPLLKPKDGSVVDPIENLSTPMVMQLSPRLVRMQPQHCEA
ncbi:hypothetical protein R3P38DRAFT_2550206, partial [Favolaschia claudopus]